MLKSKEKKIEITSIVVVPESKTFDALNLAEVHDVRTYSHFHALAAVTSNTYPYRRNHAEIWSIINCNLIRDRAMIRDVNDKRT